MHQRFLTSVEAVPGIQSAAFAEIVPLSQDDMDMGYFNIQEEPSLAAGEHLAADYRDITPNYFSTMGIPLVGGRTFTEQDNMDRPRVVVIDETLARRFFPNQDPIGKHLQVPDATKPSREIVFDGAFAARLTTLACSRAPKGHARWTVRLLAEKVVELKIAPTVSTVTIQRTLKKTNCSLT